MPSKKMKSFALHFRFFIYGLLCFALFGLVMEASSQNTSIKLIAYLAISGAISTLLASLAYQAISEFIRDLIYGNG